MALFVMAEPLSEAGKKIVTSHGDYHLKNAATAADGHDWAIDLDMAAVQYAVNDISYHFFTSDTFTEKSTYLDFGASTAAENLALLSDGNYHQLTEESQNNQKKFAKAYLYQLELNDSDEEVDKLLFDAMCAIQFGNIWTTLGLDLGNGDLERSEKYKEFQETAKNDADLQKLIRESTLRKAAIKEGVYGSRLIGILYVSILCLIFVLTN